MPHPVGLHTGHAEFSDIEIDSRNAGGVADSDLVPKAIVVSAVSCLIANPVKPGAVGVTQASRLAVDHS